MEQNALHWEDWDDSDEEENEVNHVIIPLNQSIILALLGNNPPLPSEVDTEDSDDELVYPLRRRCPFEENQPSKRLRCIYKESYYFKLTSGEEFYYDEDDEKPTLLNER